jgi:protein TonB
LTAPASFLAPDTGLLPEPRRVPVLGLVIALHVLAILMLLWLRPDLPRGKKGPAAMVAVNIAAPTPKRATPTPQQQVRPRTERSAPQPEPIVTAPDAPPSKWTFGDPALLGFDLRKVPQAESAPAQVAAAGPPDTAVVGVAPDGSPMYAAEWQREPTDAELAFYLKSARNTAPGNYGLIACRTAPRFKVEDCRPIGESPGSGLGRAVNEASWQFRVKPPRVGGEYQVGSWVSIRIDIRGAD